MVLERHPTNRTARRVLDGVPTGPRKRLHKRSYLDLFEQVARVIADADPVGLLAAGAPADEYEPEVRALIPRLQHAADLESLERAVIELFTSAFGSQGSEDQQRYRVVSERLWSGVASRTTSRLTSG
jgi:hypothetical protein